MTFAAKRFRTLFAAVLLPATLVACDDSPTEHDDHAEEVAAIRLTAGTQTVTITQAGAVTGGPITLGAGGSTAITATFLADDGDVVDLHDDEFRLDVVSGTPSVVTFQRTGPFAGTLSGQAAGQGVVAVSIFHLEEGHADFGPFNVPVTVQ